MTDLEINLEITRRLGINTDKLRDNKGLTNCPFHSDRHPSFSIDLERGIYNCFSCASKGTLKNLYYEQTGHSIMRDLGINTATAANLFKPRNYAPISYDVLPDVGVSLEGTIVPVVSSPEAMQYLKKRGITVKVANDMKMQYAYKGITKDTADIANKKKWEYINNRLITPVYEQGKLLSLEMRDVLGEAAFKESLKKNNVTEDIKYKKVLYPIHSSTSTLFQFDHLDKTKPLFFLEGLMDLGVLRADPYFKNSTSVFGASIGYRQQYMLKQFPELIYIADHDKAGLISIYKLKEQLGREFKYLFAPPKCKDVGDIPQVLKSSVEECRNKQWLTTMKSSDNFDIIEEAKRSEFVDAEDFEIIKQTYSSKMKGGT